MSKNVGLQICRPLNPLETEVKRQKKNEIFNLVGNGHLSNPMNRLNENITYLVSFFLFFISNMRTFLYDHTIPEKYPRNTTPYKMITRSTIKTQSANCPKVGGSQTCNRVRKEKKTVPKNLGQLS